MYLKFGVTGLSAPVLSAKLRLYVDNPSVDGGSVYVVSNNYENTTAAWTESGLNWNNAPAIGGTALSTAGPVNVGTWVELDVTSAISGDGLYSFGLKNNSSDRVQYSSKEGAKSPELVIEMGSSPSLVPPVISFNPTDDAEVKSSFSTTNYGANAIFRVREGAVKYHGYLKFNVRGLGGPATPVGVRKATLRLYANEGSDDGGSIYLVSNQYAGSGASWDERGLVWDNAPAIGPDGSGLSTAPQGGVSANAWVEFDVTSAITGDGIYSFGMSSRSTTTVKYSSKEGANPPELVIETTPDSFAAPKNSGFTESNPARNDKNRAILPERLTLGPNYPNPFNAQTIIMYALPEAARVVLHIYNDRGQHVRKLVDEIQPAGYRQVRWDGRDDYGREAGSGVYLIRLEAGRQRLNGKITILK
jgi:hypothetical protein